MWHVKLLREIVFLLYTYKLIVQAEHFRQNVIHECDMYLNTNGAIN